ncbi:unnamed protein product [Adineta steineri]|uniref:C2 domain-containing protein n=1 Tax=Adineta steineri TaxID=433720 RepID=A0A813Q5D2_9BILA|nr:unnamed protein product [Adineta steineri]CAF0797806.1 unnamed protein product [Adineta steineri]
MFSHSIAAGLKNTLPEATSIIGDQIPDTYDIIIRFHSAEKLPRTDLVGYTDPYFVANIDHQISFTSIIIPNTSVPVWDDEEWIVRNIPRNAKLTVKLYDKDDEKLADDYIGRFVIDDLINYTPPTKGHKILGAFARNNGRFHLSIQSMRSSEETQQLPRYTFDGPCRFSRHNSLAIGRLTMLNADCVYSTWKISMRRLSFFFPPAQRQHWNTNYKLARSIFGNCPLALVSKSTIKIGHKVLYGSTIKHNENGQLNNADDLWKYIFTDNITQRIKPCIYTYVIDDYTWRFSETGVRFFTDMASKHALLANGSEYVRYAGEFHLRPKYGWDKFDDEWELVIDNGSGTYAPDPNLLTNLKELLVFNFPGLNILTYDFEDPLLKESKEQLKLAIEKYKHITPTIDRLVGRYSPETLNECDDETCAHS